MLQFDLMEKMVNIDNRYLIYCGANYGPLFGLGGDLFIGDSCKDKKDRSWANFPNSYNKQGPNKYVQNEETYKMFSGAINSYNFRVEEY